MNKPVAWITEWKFKGEDYAEVTLYESQKGNTAKSTPLYTQEQLEEARKLGMQQERALWNLTESTQEIMNTYPVKELTQGEIHAVWASGQYYTLDKEGNVDEIRFEDFARAILRKASEK